MSFSWPGLHPSWCREWPGCPPLSWSNVIALVLVIGGPRQCLCHCHIFYRCSVIYTHALHIRYPPHSGYSSEFQTQRYLQGGQPEYTKIHLEILSLNRFILEKGILNQQWLKMEFLSSRWIHEERILHKGLVDLVMVNHQMYLNSNAIRCTKPTNSISWTACPAVPLSEYFW